MCTWGSHLDRQYSNRSFPDGVSIASYDVLTTELIADSSQSDSPSELASSTTGTTADAAGGGIVELVDESKEPHSKTTVLVSLSKSLEEEEETVIYI